jgi:preprotein translocase subunit SecF
MIDLMSKRRICFIISIVLISAGIIAVFINGLQLDIQFQGGTQITIQMDDDDFDLNRASAIAEEISGKIVTAKKLKTHIADTPERVNILMLQVGTKENLENSMILQIINAIREEFGINENNTFESQSIDPLIGAELLRNGIIAAFIASVLIVLYVWVRFSVMNGLSAAFFALVALIHDALIMFGVYTIFKIPLNESFIAALLTILGYSLNDTIIVYDRIRENSRLVRKSNVEELVNRSVVQTLSRSINTSITTVLAILCVYILASVNNIDSLRNFSFPLIIGMISGTYSSIFIASPLWMMFKKATRRKIRA